MSENDKMLIPGKPGHSIKLILEQGSWRYEYVPTEPAEPPLPCEEVEQRKESVFASASDPRIICLSCGLNEAQRDKQAEEIAALKQEVARLTDGLKFIRDCEDDGEEMGPLVTVGFLKEQARTLLGQEEPSAD